MATATHGSGYDLGALHTQVAGLELVTADGSLVTFTKDDMRQLELARVNVGALGVVSKLTMDIMPTYDIAQRFYAVCSRACLSVVLVLVLASPCLPLSGVLSLLLSLPQNAPVEPWLERVDEWAKSCHSTSAFVAWGGPEPCVELWMRDVLPDEEGPERDEVLARAQAPPPFGGTYMPVEHEGIPVSHSALSGQLVHPHSLAHVSPLSSSSRPVTWLAPPWGPGPTH